MIKKTSNNQRMKLLFILGAVLVAGLFSWALVERQSAVEEKKTSAQLNATLDSVKECIEKHKGAVLRIEPRECVIYEGSKGIDSFDKCAKAAYKRGEFLEGTNPARCTTVDGRTFVSETIRP